MDNLKKEKTVISLSPFAMIIIIVGIVLRLIYLWQFGHSPVFSNVIGPDCSEYFEWAKKIVHGQFLYEEVGIHAPGYPYFLALLMKLTGQNIYAMRLIQMILGVMALLILYFSLEKFVGKYKKFRYVSIFYLLFSMCYVPLFFYQAAFLSEALLLIIMPLLLSFLISSELLRHKDRTQSLIYLVFAAILSGLAVIIHPLSLAFAGTLGVKYLISNVIRFFKAKKFTFQYFIKRFQQTLIFGFCSLGVILPITTYNTILEKEFIPVQKNSGYNFYLGNNPDATGGCYIWPGPDWDNVHNEAEYQADLQKTTKNHIFVKKTFKFITTQPLLWIKKLGQKALYTWNQYGMSAGPDLYFLRFYTGLSDYSQWQFSILGILGLFSICLMSCKKYRRERRFFIDSLIIVLASWVILTFTVTGERYRLMMIVPLFILSAVALNILLVKYNETKSLPLKKLILLSIFAVLVILPKVPLDLNMERGQTVSILGEAYMHEKQVLLAAKNLSEAIKRLPHWPRNYNALGDLYAKQGNYKAAEKLFKMALKNDEFNGFAYMNLGSLCEQKKQVNKAREYYLKALKYTVDSTDQAKVYYNLGLLDIKSRKYKQAIKSLAFAHEYTNYDAKVTNAYAVALSFDKQYNKALKLLLTAVKNHPQNINILNSLAFVHNKLNNKAAADNIIETIKLLEKQHKKSSP